MTSPWVGMVMHGGIRHAGKKAGFSQHVLNNTGAGIGIAEEM